ncbi:MAG: hypothetical protein K2L58_08885 [Duncaniella sp.]|nr:hypothetical protein [Duncaniella sp.]
MKKIVVVFVVLVVSVVCGYSQSGQISENVPKKGYRGFVDLSGEALFEKKHSNDRDIVYSLSGFTTTHGYQFNEHFFVGAGLGIDFITYNFQSASFAIDYPIFVSGRADWKVGKVPLFADLRLGSFIKTCRGYNNDKLFINPSIGYHCSWGRRVSLNIGAGLSVHWLDRYSESGLRLMPSVRIGLEFR